MVKGVLVLITLLGIVGCASPPHALRDAPAESPLLAEVRAAPADYQNRQVLWGGLIDGVENQADRTLIEVVARPLRDNGRPRADEEPEGRFLAVVPGFVEPESLERRRAITVVGTITGAVERPVGDYPYRYVTVEVASRYLWSPARAGSHNHWHDPFWGPPVWGFRFGPHPRYRFWWYYH